MHSLSGGWRHAARITNSEVHSRVVETDVRLSVRRRHDEAPWYVCLGGEAFLSLSPGPHEEAQQAADAWWEKVHAARLSEMREWIEGGGDRDDRPEGTQGATGPVEGGGL